MRLFSCSVLALLITSTAFAAREGYYRQPAIHGDTVVFVAEGDLWTVSSDGGVAQRLTTHAGLESHPTISPDGTRVAFSAEYEGPTEIYTMAIEGGLPTRMTFEGSSSDRYKRPVGWTVSGELIYHTRAFSTAPSSQLRVLSTGGPAEGALIPLAQAADGVFGDGSLFFTRLPFNGSYGKRYEGGTIEHIWRFDGAEQEAVSLTADFAGVSRDPMWWDGRVYFASERDGTLNLWSMTLSGSDLQQHTTHFGWDVLGPAQSDGRIVYQHKADLRLHEIQTGNDRIIPITLNSDFDQMRENWVEDPASFISSWNISPNGDRLLLTARGEVFVIPVKSGRLVHATRASEVRYRQGQFMPEGDQVLVLSDESGEVDFWTLPARGVGDRKQMTNDATVLRMASAVSPDGKRIAYSDKDFKLWVHDIDGDVRTFVDEAGNWYITDFAWSPDSRWLAYALQDSASSHNRIRIFDTDSGASTQVTSDAYNSFDPEFSPDGAWLYFMSERHFRTLVGSPWGPRQPEPFFDRPVKIYAMALQPGVPSPFMEENELMADEDDEDDDTDGGEANGAAAEEEEDDGEEDEGVTVEIEFDGLSERLFEAPAPNGNYSNLRVTDKHLYFSAVDDLHKRETTLRALEISREDPKVVDVAGDINSALLSLDGKKLLIRKDNDFFVVDATGKEVKLDKDSKVDLSGWTFSMTPREEWRQMFTESWRLMRDYFYDRDMHGVDWPGMLAKHLPYVDRVTDRAELSDLMAQMVSELSALHTFVRGGDQRDGDDQVRIGSLGARLVRDESAGGYRIEHIYQSDPDEPERRGPLARPDLAIEVGDVITMINGVPLLDIDHYRRLLRNQVGKQVLLRIDPADGPSYDAIVHPMSLRAEADLRYHEWEYTNRLYVEENSDGRIGYIHLRAMGAGNMAEWIRQYPRVFEMEGLVVDMRFNRGGNIDSWILGRLLRQAWFYWQGRAGEPSWNMQQAFRGHKATLINEYTASDGEAFSEGFRRLGMGPLIGTRTWGGGIWLTSSNVLVDGGIATAAEFGVYAPEGEWIIEGTGIEPDIEVDNLPYSTHEGSDAQLDAAIAHLMERIEEEPIVVPAPPAGKDLSLPGPRR